MPHIDIVGGKNDKSLGIYELDGDKLKICFAKERTGRPTEFKRADGVTVVTLKREKK